MHQMISSRRASSSRRAHSFLVGLLLAGTTFSSLPVLAQGGSPRSQAWELRQSNPAEAARQLEEVVRADPRDAKAFWFLALVYNDLNRGADGLRALQGARAADPSLGFASSPTAVEKIERSLQRDSGRSGSGGTSTSNRGSSPIAPRGNTRTQGTQGVTLGDQQAILSALQSSGVYVSPSMANTADANVLQSAVRSHPHGAKVLVLDSLPAGVSIGRFAQNLHRSLSMRDGLMVVATGNPRQAAAHGGSLIKDKSELDAIVKANSATFTAQSYTAGIQGILNQHAAEENSANKGANTFLLLLVGVPAGAGVLLWKRAKKGKEEKLAALQTETRDMANKLAPQYEKLDSDFEFAVLGQTDQEKGRELREARAHSGEAFSNAMKQLNNAGDINSLVAARSSLLYAKDSMENARAVLEGRPLPNQARQMAGGGGGMGQMGGAMGAFGPGGMGQGDSGAQDIGLLGTNYPNAQPGHALDFFTSQPVPISDMVPVEINVNGQRQRVWASRDSAQRALNGQPQVATVNYGGQNVPWYNAPQQYNPWSDFGSSMVQMMALNMMMNSMFHSHGHAYVTNNYFYDNNPGYGGGYGGGGYSGGYDNSGHDNSGYVDDSGGSGVANLDLFGGGNDSGGGGGYDNSSSLDMFGGGGSSWSSDSS